ncbi:MAG: beta strand repeat-containing protein, partial [Lawsonibacter sp.]
MKLRKKQRTSGRRTGSLKILAVLLILLWVIPMAAFAETEDSLPDGETSSSDVVDSDSTTGGTEGSTDGTTGGTEGSTDGATGDTEGSTDGTTGGTEGSTDGTTGGTEGSTDGATGDTEGSTDGATGDTEGSTDGTTGDTEGSTDGTTGGTEGSTDGTTGGTEEADSEDASQPALMTQSLAVPLLAAPAAEATTPTTTQATTPTTTQTTQTTQTYEIPEGSAYVVGSESTVYKNTSSANAIQQAIDAAIKASQDSVTVVVNNGVYTGGITVVAVSGSSTTDGEEGETGTLALNIIAADSFTKTDDGGVPTDEYGDVEVNANSAGGVQVEGGLSAENVNLLLAGLYFALKEREETKNTISSSTGSTSTTTTSGSDRDSNEILVKNADSFAYYGTELADDVNIELTDVSDSVTVDTGAGDDTLNLSVAQTPSAVIDTGKTTPQDLLDGSEDLQSDVLTAIQNGISEGINQLASAITGDDGTTVVGYQDNRLNVTVETGDGDDEIVIKLVNSTEVVLPGEDTSGTGTEPTNITVNVDLSASKVTISSGNGADEITLKGGMELDSLSTTALQPLLNAVYQAATELSQATELEAGDGTRAMPQTTIEVKGGAGDDLINVDTTAAFSSFRGVDVTAYGNGTEGGAADNEFDRIHLTGKVDDNYMTAGDHRLEGSLNADGTGSIHMDANAEISVLNDALSISELYADLNVSLIDVDAVTDVLQGKHTVEATLSDMADETFASFTDYVITDYTDNASFTNPTGAGTFLSNLYLMGTDLKVGSVKVPNINLILTAGDSGLNDAGSITVNGDVEGRNILLLLSNTDSHKLTLLENDLQDDDEDLAIEASLFDIVSDVKIALAEGASLTAAQAVDISASSKQTQGLLPTLSDLTAGLGEDQLAAFDAASNLNFVAVKTGSAVIEILGDITAGAVRASAKSYVDTDATNEALASFGLPLAVGVVISEAGVSVGGDAKLQSNIGGITLKANSSVALTTEARSGRLPFTLAVSVVDNDAYVDIKGSSALDADGDITASAKGGVQVRTISTGTSKMPQTSYGQATSVTTNDQTPSQNSNQLDVGKSGGFFAVSVVNQDVFASIIDQARAVAGGGLNVNSAAREYVVNEATSNPDEGGQSMALDQLLLKVDSLLTQTTSKLSSTGTQQGSQQTQQKKTSALTGIVNQLTGKTSTGTTTNTGVGSLVNSSSSGATNGTGNTTNSIQLVGALAVTYAGNHNQAYIDTVGVIAAGGTLGVRAEGSMTAVTLADGSPVKRTSAGSTGTASGIVAASPKDILVGGGTYGVVTVPSMNNGTIFVDNATTPAANDTVNISVMANAGYKLQTDASGQYYVTVSNSNDTATEVAQKVLVTLDAATTSSKTDGTIWYTGSYDLARAGDVLNATFVAKGYTITCANAEPAGGSFAAYPDPASTAALYYADAGEDVYIKVKTNSGYTASVTYTVATTTTDANGNTTTTQGSPVTVQAYNNGAVDADGNQLYHFVMPSGNVTVSVAYAGQGANLEIQPGSSYGVFTVKKADGTVLIDNDAATTAPSTTASTGLNPVNVGDTLTLTINMTGKTDATGNQWYVQKNTLRFSGTTPVYIKNITWDEASKTYTCQITVPSGANAGTTGGAYDTAVITCNFTTNKSLAQGTIKNTSTALGVGVAVSVVDYTNSAYIKSGAAEVVTTDAETGDQTTDVEQGTIRAGGIEVTAKTQDASSSAIAKAGFTAADLGLAGALTVHVAT